MGKKIVFAIINIISILVIAAAVFVLLVVLVTAPGKPPSIMGYTVLRITTGSMAPTYDVDTMIVVKKPEPSQIREGDVITFYSTDPALEGSLNTHRVVSISQEGDGYVYVTKGDNNNVVDAYDVPSENLLGKVVGSSMILGKISRLCANPLVFIPIILVPLAIILISNLVRTVAYTRKIMKDEEQAAIQEAIQKLREKKSTEQSEKPEEQE